MSRVNKKEMRIRKIEGFTLAEIMIVVAIIAVLAAIAIPNLLTARKNANESAAQAGLRILSTSLETYYSVNNAYAVADDTTTDDYLRSAAPPYLTTAYCTQTVSGYTYTCDIDLAAYSIVAAPSSCGTTGNRTFTITTGSSLTSAACGS